MKLKSQKCNLPLVVLVLILGLFQQFANSQATFPCDGSFFISLNSNGPPTVTHQVNYDGVSASFNTLMTTNLVVNATGFNPKDNYIYAINRVNQDIVRLYSDGGFAVVGTEPNVSSWQSGAGDCSPDGIYAVHHRPSDQIFFYNVTGTFSLESVIEIYWDPTSGNSGVCDLDFDEIVFDPQLPNVMYSYQRNYSNFGEPTQTQGSLLRIDVDQNSPTYGMVSVVGDVPINVMRHMGAMFFDSFGTLFGYGSPSINPVVQNTLIAIDKTSGDATTVGVGPGASGNDGCSCPFSVELLKEIVEVDIQCDITTIVYEFTVANNSFSPISNVNFIDQLPFNGVVTAMLPSNPLGGTAGAGSGVGSSSIVFNDFSLSEQQSATFQVYVEMPTQIGTFPNQAQLTGLPNSLSGIVLSDDPTTFAFEDPTILSIQSDDIQGPVESIFGVICDNEFYDFNGDMINTTGEYTQVIQNGSVLGCDSTIILTLNVNPTPEEIIDRTICVNSSYTINNVVYSTTGTYTEVIPGATSNGCDSTIILNLTLADTLFGYESYVLCPDDSIVIEGQVFNQTGSYEVFTLNGALAGCDTLIIVDILMEEDLDFDITANDTYCIGDEFGSIEVSGGPDGSAPFLFSLNGGPYEDSNFFPNLTPGFYNISVEASNGCIANFENIEVENISQTLYLFAQNTDFEIDLGDQVFLNIEANFPMNQISWNPDTYLSCNDCPNPISLPTEDIDYIATVIYGDDCIADIQFSIRIKNRSQIYIPNVFSPNGDGNNDIVTVFAGKGVDIVEEFRIFDRWGEEVFHAFDFPPNDLNFGWDGVLKGKLMQPAVFAYYARVLRIDGVEELRKGDITLLR